MALGDTHVLAAARMVDRSKVGSGHAGAAIIVVRDAGLFPWADAARPDGADIRASADAAGLEELPIDPVAFDGAAGTGLLAIRHPAVSDTADAALYFWTGRTGGETRPAVGAANGAHSVWQDFAAVWTGHGLTDRTGGGHDRFRSSKPNLPLRMKRPIAFSIARPACSTPVVSGPSTSARISPTPAAKSRVSARTLRTSVSSSSSILTLQFLQFRAGQRRRALGARFADGGQGQRQFGGRRLPEFVRRPAQRAACRTAGRQRGLGKARHRPLRICDSSCFSAGVTAANPCCTTASLISARAKQVAEACLRRLWDRRRSGELRLPFHHIHLAPNDAIRLSDGSEWIVIGTEIAGVTVTLSVEQRVGAGPQSPPAADGGTPLVEADIPQGETVTRVFELPPMDGDPDSSIRLRIAAGGRSPSWRYAEVLASLDAEESWRSIGVISTAAKMGRVSAVPMSADSSSWDMQSFVIVDMLDDQALENASRNAVLSGANLAKVGDELLQFCRAEEVAPRRWRLSGLLRGRRGTEAAMTTHVEGEAFLLLESEAIMPFDVPLDRLGGTIHIKAAGPADSLPLVPVEAVTISGANLRPLSPVHIHMRRGAARMRG